VRPPSTTTPRVWPLSDPDRLSSSWLPRRVFPTRGESSEVVQQSHPAERALCEGGSDHWQGHLHPRHWHGGHQRGGPLVAPDPLTGRRVRGLLQWPCQWLHAWRHPQTREVRHRSRPGDTPSPGSASRSWWTSSGAPSPTLRLFHSTCGTATTKLFSFLYGILYRVNVSRGSSPVPQTTTSDPQAHASWSAHGPPVQV
jgi:hypothetical protein